MSTTQPVDLRYEHGTPVYVVRACPFDDAADLVAIGGDHSVEVIFTTPTSCRNIASFHVGCRITAIAWSNVSTSPSTTDAWTIELTAAGADFGLYSLKKSRNSTENVFAFGGGLSGHHGKVNDMAFCGGQVEDSSRYVATVADDKMMMVWDLRPDVDIDTPPSPEMERDTPPRRQPTAYVIAFSHPLMTVSAHPSTSKEFLVSDCRGNIFLTDWRSDPDENEQDAWRNASVIELVEPRALAQAATSAEGRWSGCASWRRDSAEIIGSTYGSRFAIWDLAKLQGGKPLVTGTSFPEGAHHFKWCPNYPEFFAIASAAPTRGAIINVHNTTYASQPTPFILGPRPLVVRDLDFLAARGIPRIAAAVGREVVILYIGVAE